MDNGKYYVGFRVSGFAKLARPCWGGAGIKD